VHAVDVQTEMISVLDRQMAKRGLRSVVSVLGSETTVAADPVCDRVAEALSANVLAVAIDDAQGL
jgi:hypothetical protein